MKQKKIIKMRPTQTRNTFGVSIYKCCASCVHKDLTRAVTLRRCTQYGRDVKQGDVCNDWAMSNQLKMAGRSQGRVKRKEYLMFLVAVREEESLAEQLGLKITAKSIEQIKTEFEREHGSIYEPDFRPFDQEW